uniref:hypothetical protein n=1 Tax=uncultured Dialister sp. TaxID=278064 RepID=UPI00266F4384
ATSWPSSPKGDARTLRDLLFCVIWLENNSADWFAALVPLSGCAIGHAFGVRVHRVQKVQKVQRVMVAAPPQILKKGAE